MTKPLRLFDLPQYQLENQPLSNMLAAKIEGEWVNYSTEWFIDTVQKVSAKLCEEGIGFESWTAEQRDKIAIISENRPEWLIVDHAVQQCGAILVPIYPTINIHELKHILIEAEIKWLFISNELHYNKAAQLLSQIPTLKRVYSFDKLSQPKVFHWKELLETPEQSVIDKINHIKSNTRPDDVATIIYTSGTSGTPKGVMLSHHNILSNVLSGYHCLPINENGRALSFLPLNHIYERMLVSVYIYASVPTYFAESISKIGDNLKEVRPYFFATVPRLLEKVYEKILATGENLTGIKRKLFFWALDLGEQYELHTKKRLSYKIQLAIANKLVFSKWRSALGGEVQAIVTGSAACQIRLLKLFSAAGITIMEGYGLTETSPVVSVNRFEKGNRKFGTIGPLLEGVKAKISPEGEILCKGPNIMIGYYKKPQLTKTVIEDGWFKTGDIGEWVDEKFLKITDRKKELFKLSGGKYIAPLPIETKMAESPLINQIMIVGSNEKFVGALIIPDFPKLCKQLKSIDLETQPLQEIIAQPEVYQLFKQEIKHYNLCFGQLEQIKKFKLLAEEWTIEKGELTPTLKLKRRIIKKQYQDNIDSLYH